MAKICTNIPQHLALIPRTTKDFMPKCTMANIANCHEHSISPALSKLRDQGYQVLMQWQRDPAPVIYAPRGRWTYKIVPPSRRR